MGATTEAPVGLVKVIVWFVSERISSMSFSHNGISNTITLLKVSNVSACAGNNLAAILKPVAIASAGDFLVAISDTLEPSIFSTAREAAESEVIAELITLMLEACWGSSLAPKPRSISTLEIIGGATVATVFRKEKKDKIAVNIV